MNKWIGMVGMSIERVLRVLEKRETSTAKERTRDARANRESGFYWNQYGDGLLTRQHVCSKLDLK